MSWFDGLEPSSSAYQIAASPNERIRVVAGPGTGKSFAMQKRVARLLENGVDPRTLLPVTFTRVAAQDLHRELVNMQVVGCDQIEGTTLHSLAFRILRRQRVLESTGRTPRPLNNFEFNPLVADLKLSDRHARTVKNNIQEYEAAWATLQHEEPGHVRTADQAEFQHELISWLQFHRSMLIGEVVPHLYLYLRDNPACEERGEFSHVLVDEYQDLNKAEQKVLDYLADNADMCIIGDDDQSIYSFKYAHPSGIREWISQHDEVADISMLECRRCPTRVVQMATSLIQNNQDRPVPRSLNERDENGEGDVHIYQYNHLSQEVESVASIISRMISDGVSPGDILILAQRGAIGTPLYNCLRQRGVPVKSYYAESELDAQEAQRRLAVLKIYVDRDDRVALRWLLGLNGTEWRARSYRRLREHCEASGESPWVALERLDAGNLHIPHTSGLVAKFREVRDEVDALEGLATFEDVIESLFPADDESISELRGIAYEVLELVGVDDRQSFLNELTNYIAKPEPPSEIDYVRIMSLHKSKGLSSPVTFICGCVDGLLPQQPDSNLADAEKQAKMEEQRRLFYVGLTRVKAVPRDQKPGTLVLTYSLRMPTADALGAGMQPARIENGVARLHASRFLSELGPSAPEPERGR